MYLGSSSRVHSICFGCHKSKRRAGWHCAKCHKAIVRSVAKQKRAKAG